MQDALKEPGGKHAEPRCAASSLKGSSSHGVFLKGQSCKVLCSKVLGFRGALDASQEKEEQHSRAVEVPVESLREIT